MSLLGQHWVLVGTATPNSICLSLCVALDVFISQEWTEPRTEWWGCGGRDSDPAVPTVADGPRAPLVSASQPGSCKGKTHCHGELHPPSITPTCPSVSGKRETLGWRGGLLGRALHLGKPVSWGSEARRPEKPSSCRPAGMSSTTNTSLPAICVRDFQSLPSQRGDVRLHVPVLILLRLAGPGRENSELHRVPLDCVHSLPLG